jgi:hypothetical protein
LKSYLVPVRLARFRVNVSRIELIYRILKILSDPKRVAPHLFCLKIFLLPFEFSSKT